MSPISTIFLVFFVSFLPGYHLLRKQTDAQRLWLIAASLLFYGWVHWWFVPILLATSLLDFWLAHSANKKPALIVTISVLSNIGLLLGFKFGGVLTGNDSWIIPLGVSFYTLQSLGYVVDVSKGLLPPVTDYRKFLVLVCMFPHLSAGPIIRVKTMLPQLDGEKGLSLERLWMGLPLIAQGYFKKCVLGDSLAPVVQALLADQHPSTANAWVGMCCFAFQIFFDFSGYSDMARGLGKVIGYELAQNFNSPYLSQSIGEFWRRWHISLSLWIRDYVYIPLGGSRGTKFQTSINTVLAMAISGVWHQSHVTCLVYGLWHGVLICLERLAPGVKKFGILSVILTFALVVYGWVWLISPNVETALRLSHSMITPNGGLSLPVTFKVRLILVSTLGYLVFCYAREKGWRPQIATAEWMIYARTAVLAGLAIAYSAPPAQFFYFHF